MRRSGSYLSERQYAFDDREGYDTGRYEYWEKMFGEKSFQSMLKHCQEFQGYLKQLPYHLKGEDKKRTKGESGGLMEYIESSSASGRQVSFTGFGTELLRGRLSGYCEFFSENLYSDFSNHLNQQLQTVYLRTFILNLHESKGKGLLKGKDAKEEYEYFCSRIAGDAENVTALFEQYPVLYRCMEKKIGQMVDFYEEILCFFKQDREEICKKLCKGREIRRIVKISGSFSDLHNQGKQVLKIRLDDGTDILYKPHSMENEESYQRLLRWLADMTGLTQYDYPFLSYENHSWSSIVRYQTCKSEMELERYYRRLGVHIFLAYLLGTKDLHSENVIASGEYPVLIDLETLVNITFNRKRATANEEICYQLAQSVLYTGLLPFYSWNYNGNGINSSAISGIEGQVYPFKVPRIKNAGTSDIYIDYCYPESGKDENLATVNGKFQSPSGYRMELLEGFKGAYQAVLGKKKEFSAMLEELRETKSRFLLADTQRYAMLLAGSYHPSLLKDGADRELFLWTMWMGRSEKGKNIIKSEVKDLLDGDVPYFSYRLSETALYDSREERFGGYFEKPAMDILHDRLEKLDADDRDKQCGYICLALALMPENSEDCINRVYSAKRMPKEKDALKDGRDAASVCSKLTERLLKYAVWNHDKTQVGWFKVQMSAYGKQTWNIMPMNMYLYDGLAGMLLIFDALKRKSDRKEIADIAVTLKKMLFCYTDAGITSSDRLNTKNTGAYEGEASILYTYLLLNRQTGEGVYLEYAKRHAEIVGRLLGADNKYDLLTGNAGAAAVLLMLYEAAEDSKYLSMAEYAVEVLFMKAQRQETGVGWTVEKGIPPMAGMAHGNSGVLMAVTTLWEKTGRKKYQALAEEIWAYENTLYSREKNNWRDVRGEDEKDDTGAVAWCHGAAGVLLSRVYCYQHACTKEWRKRMKNDMMHAYEKVKDCWRRDSFTLCHGTCGNLWILEKAAKAIGEETVWYDVAGSVRLLPQEIINPGFMNGYGGILYYLLLHSCH